MCGLYSRSRPGGLASRTPRCFGGRVARRRFGVRREICAGYSFTLNVRADPGVDPARALIEQALLSSSHRFKHRWAVGLRGDRLLSAHCAEGAAHPAPGHAIPRDSVPTLRVCQPCRNQAEAVSARFAIIRGHSCLIRQRFQQRWSRALFAPLTSSNERSPRSRPRNRSPLRPSNCGPRAEHALLH